MTKEKESTKLRKMRNNFILGFFMYIVIPLTQFIIVTLVTLKTVDIPIVFFSVLGISMVSFLVVSVLKKAFLTKAFKSIRQFVQKILLLLIKAVLYSGSVVLVVFVFIFGEQDLYMFLDGVMWINGTYIIRYVFVYGAVYIITVGFTWFSVRR